MFEANNLGSSQNNNTLVISRHRCNIVHNDAYGYYTFNSNEFHKLLRFTGLSDNPETLRYQNVLFLLDKFNENDYHLLESLINTVFKQNSSALNSFLQFVSCNDVIKSINFEFKDGVNLMYEKTDDFAESKKVSDCCSQKYYKETIT